MLAWGGGGEANANWVPQNKKMLSFVTCSSGAPRSISKLVMAMRPPFTAQIEGRVEGIDGGIEGGFGEDRCGDRGGAVGGIVGLLGCP